MSTNKSIMENLLPDWETDHGGITLGDVMVLIFDGILLIYTAWRSFDLLSGTVPEGMEIMAVVGLVGLDIGAVLWSLVWIFGSATKYQDWIAMTFFIIDISGVILTSLTDSLLYGDSDGVMFKMLEPVAMILIPAIILGNVVAGFIYHMTSPDTRARRAHRKIQEKEARLSEKIRENKMLLQHTQNALLQRQQEVQQGQVLAKIKINLDALERGVNNTLTGGAHVDEALGQLGIPQNNANMAAYMPSVKVGTLEAELAQQISELNALTGGSNGTQALVPVPVGAGADIAGAGGGIGMGTGNGKGAFPGWKNLLPFLKEKSGNIPPATSDPNADVTVDAPVVEVKETPYTVYFRTNSPYKIVSIKTDGADFKVAHPVEGLRFVTPSPLAKAVIWQIKDELTPRGYGDGKPVRGYRASQQGEPDRYLEITDWDVVALEPGGNANPPVAGAKS